MAEQGELAVAGHRDLGAGVVALGDVALDDRAEAGERPRVEVQRLRVRLGQREGHGHAPSVLCEGA